MTDEKAVDEFAFCRTDYKAFKEVDKWDAE